MLYVNSSPMPMAIGQLVSQQLAEIGLEVEVRGIPIHSASAAYFKKLATGGEPWDIAFGLWSPELHRSVRVHQPPLRPTIRRGHELRALRLEALRSSRCAARRGCRREAAVAAPTRRSTPGSHGSSAPMAAIDFLNEPTLVSKRVGCVVLRPVLDLTAVCLK